MSRLLTQHNQGITQWSPDPFPRERVGSGHEAKCPDPIHFSVKEQYVVCETLLRQYSNDFISPFSAHSVVICAAVGLT